VTDDPPCIATQVLKQAMLGWCQVRSLVAHSQLVDIHSLLSMACSLAPTAAQMIDLTLVFFPKTYGGLSSAGGMTKPRRINSANRS